MNSANRRTRAGIGRSRLLVVTAMSLFLCTALAACGGGVSGDTSTTQATVAKAEGAPSGKLTISNWPLYISPDTVPGFDKATGVDTNYVEDYNSNEEFYAKIVPSLEKGDSGGRSLLAAPSPFIVERMIGHGFLQKLDKSAIPNVTANLLPQFDNPSYDPDSEFSAPWQSGMMGLAVRTDLAPDIKSACDLFDPQYKGKVELFTEMRQTLGVIMKCMGVDTNKPISEDDWMAAIDKVAQAKADGQLRKFAGNDWTNELLRGDVVATTGASGDTYQLTQENPDIQWVMPEEGCIIFTNLMVIPTGAPNPTAAYAFMDYVYDPKNAAKITEYTHYLTPVDGVREEIKKTDPELAKSPLVFPEEKDLTQCSPEPTLDPAFEQKVTEAWNAVING